MEQIFSAELIKQIPWGMAMIAIVFLFLKAEEKRDARRIAREKAEAEIERDHEMALEKMRKERDIEVNGMLAKAIKSMVEGQEKANEIIVAALREHERASMERYKKLGVTRELVLRAAENLETKPKGIDQ